MKKKIYLLALTTLICGNLFAQTLPASRTEEYCDIVMSEKTFSSKVEISVDYGLERKKKDEKLKDASGKTLLFNSPVDVLNYMNAQGWELVEIYDVRLNKFVEQHYLLKRRVSS